MSQGSIGERVRIIRGAESRKSFAEKFGIGTATLQRYEDNERTPDIEFLVRLQNYAEVTLDYLVHGTDVNLITEELNLLNNYRVAPREVKNEAQLLLIGVKSRDTTNDVVINANNTSDGEQYNAKKQVFGKPKRINNFNGNFGGDYVEGDKKNR